MSDEPLTAATFTGHTTVILARNAVSDADVTLLTNWVQGGGNLIAMRPDKKLAGLLGITDAGATLRDGYLKVDQGSAAGAGIEGMTLQFHDLADRYALSGATAVATLYSDISTGTTSPAVSLRDVGTGGGQAAAFSYDLARSVIWTRQGNPAWAGQKRDGLPPLSIRPDDLFYGAKAGDVQPDWVHHDRLEVPQADEQQRLLANLITQMNLDKAPLPRLWYLPRGDKAAVVLTGDDHAVGGTSAYFDRLKASSPPGCSVADWECVRATSYMYPNTPNFTPAQAKAYQDAGFEVALHLNTGCQDWTPESLDQMYSSQLGSFAATWPDVTPPMTNRTHCIVWSDWASQAKIERGPRHPLRHQLLLQGPGPPGRTSRPCMTGLGLPAALRRPRRVDDRRLPVDDADHGRDERDAADDVADPRAARQRARAEELLGRLRRDPALGRRRPPAAERARGRRPGPRRADRHLRADAVVARRAQRLRRSATSPTAAASSRSRSRRTRPHAGSAPCCPRARRAARS